MINDWLDTYASTKFLSDVGSKIGDHLVPAISSTLRVVRQIFVWNPSTYGGSTLAGTEWWYFGNLVLPNADICGTVLYWEDLGPFLLAHINGGESEKGNLFLIFQFFHILSCLRREDVLNILQSNRSNAPPERTYCLPLNPSPSHRPSRKSVDLLMVQGTIHV